MMSCDLMNSNIMRKVCHNLFRGTDTFWNYFVIFAKETTFMESCLLYCNQGPLLKRGLPYKKRWSHVTKGDNVCDFLFDLLLSKPPSEKGSNL